MKMLNRFFIFSLIMFLFLSSCKLSLDKHNLKNSDLPIPIVFEKKLTQKYFYLSDFTDKIEYLKLETTDSCYLKKINKIVNVNTELFVSDGERLFVFDRNTGHFIRNIGKIGRGPGEYNKVEDFTIFPKENVLFITDLQSGILHKFDLAGNFYKKYKLPHAPFKINNIENKLIGLYSFPDFIFNDMNSLLISDLLMNNKETLIDRSYTGINESLYKNLVSSSRSRLEYFNDTLTYWEFENDTIYRILDAKTYRAAYNLIFPSNEHDANWSKFSDLIETKDYIFFLLGVNTIKQEIIHCIFDKRTHQNSAIKFPFENLRMQLRAGIINNIDNGWPFLPIGCTNENELYCYFFKHELDTYIEISKSVDLKVPQFVLNSTVNDNPVIMFCKLKEN